MPDLTGKDFKLAHGPVVSISTGIGGSSSQDEERAVGRRQLRADPVRLDESREWRNSFRVILCGLCTLPSAVRPRLSITYCSVAVEVIALGTGGGELGHGSH